MANFCTIPEEQFKFVFQEHGVTYNESEATDYKVEASLSIQSEHQPSFILKVDQKFKSKFVIVGKRGLFISQGVEFMIQQA